MSTNRKADSTRVVSTDLLSVLDDYFARGGRCVFWECPHGCRDLVDWHDEGGKHVATCKRCGTKSTDNGRGEPHAPK